MNSWIFRLLIIALAIALLPMVVTGTAKLVSSGIHAVGNGIHGLLAPLSMSGSARLEGVIKLCLYLVAITLLIRVILPKRDGGE